MATVRRVALSLLSLGAFGGAGFLLWQVVPPNQQRSLEMRKHFPEANPATLADTQKQNELVFKVIKQAAERTRMWQGNPRFASES